MSNILSKINVFAFKISDIKSVICFAIPLSLYLHLLSLWRGEKKLLVVAPFQFNTIYLPPPTAIFISAIMFQNTYLQKLYILNHSSNHYFWCTGRLFIISVRIYSLSHMYCCQFNQCESYVLKNPQTHHAFCSVVNLWIFTRQFNRERSLVLWNKTIWQLIIKWNISV